MTSGVDDELLTLQNLVETKEQEWRSLSQEHSKTLEKALVEKTKQCNLEKTRFRKLKEDFEYNLSLIADRDEELKKYDVLLSDYKKKESLWISEVSESKIKCDEMRIYCDQLVKEKQELQRHYTMRVNDLQTDAECFYKKKEDEMQNERQEYEELKRKIQLQLRDSEDDLAIQRQQMLFEFDTEMTKKDQLHSKVVEEKDSQIHAHLLQIKTLNREIQLHQQNLTSSNENTDQAHEENAKLKKALKEKEWELQDVQNMMSLKIKDLTKQIELSEKEFNRKEEDLMRKFNNESKLCLEKEEAINQLRIAYEEQDQSQVDNIKKIQISLEEKDVEIRRLHWNITDTEREHELRVKALQEQIDELEEKSKREAELHTQHTVTRDVELEALRHAHSTYQEELKRREEDVSRYKKDLSNALHREKILEKAKAQLELDWRHKFEKVESDQYQKQEDLIAAISKAKDDALENVNEKNKLLGEQEKLMKAFQKDRASIIAILRHNDIPLPTLVVGDSDYGIDTNEDENENVEKLIQQNSQLRDVVAQMRSEMEILNKQLITQQPDPDTNSRVGFVSNDYSRDLEDEIKKLKSTNRDLQSKLDEASKNLRHKPPPHTRAPTGNESVILNHFKELNSTIGALRNEKVQLTAKLQSQSSKLSFLQRQVVNLEGKLQQKALSAEQLMFEISSKHQYETDDRSGLLQRIGELEMLLNAARSEVDVYCKSNMENNLKLTTLGNEFSTLKVQTASKEQPTQVEVLPDVNRSQGETAALPDTAIKKKLSLAIEKIKVLTHEKDQLIHMGNKLRAEISSLKGKLSSQSGDPQNVISTQSTSQLKDFSSSVTSRLKKLEKLQYATTSSELKTVPKLNHVEVNVDPISSVSENMSPISVRTSQPPLTSSSEHSSIQEIWKLLEQSTPRLDLSNRMEQSQTLEQSENGAINEEPEHDVPDEYYANERINSSMQVTGTTITASNRSPVKSRASQIIKRPSLKQKKSRVRNYNIRDDNLNTND